MTAKHAPATRHGEGEYEYRGYTITDHGEGRSVHAAIMRTGGRWLIRKKTGPGYYDSKPVGRSVRTLREAKAWIDALLLRSLGEDA